MQFFKPAKKKRSIESALISDLKIPKKDILASLGQFYDAETVEFTPNLPIPGDLLSGLKVPFLRNNFWVPLGEKDGSIVIAIDNPHDQQRIGEMKALFPEKKFKFCVALKQDIIEISDHARRTWYEEGPLKGPELFKFRQV
jgi:hypothetical protein